MTARVLIAVTVIIAAVRIVVGAATVMTLLQIMGLRMGMGLGRTLLVRWIMAPIRSLTMEFSILVPLETGLLAIVLTKRLLACIERESTSLLV